LSDVIDVVQHNPTPFTTTNYFYYCHHHHHQILSPLLLILTPAPPLSSSSRYAAEHNYILRLYHVNDHQYNERDIKNSDACHHPTEGWRASPWCKLVSVMHTLKQGDEDDDDGKSGSK